MKCKIATSRELLETARKLLDGNDLENEKLREVLDLTIEVFMLAEHSRRPFSPKVVRFPLFRSSARPADQ
jgi:hypothetical protein